MTSQRVLSKMVSKDDLRPCNAHTHLCWLSKGDRYSLAKIAYKTKMSRTSVLRLLHAEEIEREKKERKQPGGKVGRPQVMTARDKWKLKRAIAKIRQFQKNA